LGANIANTSLVAGLAALVFGRITVHGDFIKKDILVALLAGFLPLVLILDGSLSRVDGLILLATYGAYVTSIFRGRYMEIAEEHKKESFFYRFIRQFNNVNTARNRELGRLFVGVALLLFSSDIIVRIAKELAVAAHIPIFLVGLVILSIGTTLPELVFSLRSIENHEPGMFFGNILGSVIANSTLVIGIAATISPIKIVALDEYFIAALTFVVVFLSYWLFIRTKHRLDRWEAALLVGFYVFFVVLAFV
jgi:cation:H+ antiporter